MAVLKLKTCRHGNTDECLACYDEEIARLRAALETIKRHVVGEAAINWSCGPATYQSRMYLADVCDAALTPNAELTDGPDASDKGDD